MFYPMALVNTIAPDLARQNLAVWLNDSLPGASDVTIPALDIPSASGLSCQTVLFEAAWAQGGAQRRQAFVARVAPVGGGGLMPEYDLEAEAAIMRALAGNTDVPAPSVLLSETDVGVLGGPFLVMERLDGTVPSDDPPYSLQGWVVDLEADAQRRLLDNAIATVAAVARVDCQALGLASAIKRAGLAQQLDHLRVLYDTANRGSAHETIEAGFEYLAANAPEDEPLALSWGDARIGNMIFDAEQAVIGALDWELAAIASPEADLGYFLYALRLWSEGYGAPSPPGFPPTEEIVSRFEELSGHTARHLDYYERYSAVFGAIMVLRAGHLMIDAGLIPPDSPMPTTNPASVMLADYLGLPAPGGTVTGWAGHR
jgi:aminoglycoside phosphotransferase (APT) family kinase protein